MIDCILAVIILVITGWAIAKNYDAKVVLFAAGLVMLYLALISGHDVLGAKATSGLAWADPFKVIKDQFVRQFSNAGLIILTLFGFAAYMSHIGANDMVIKVLTKPLSKIKHPALLIPLVFWIGTCLQIIIPSAASLAVILMGTLYPVLRAAGLSTLTAAALIATTATIVPTPLGGDNVVAARVLGFENVVDYVFYHCAPITIPALFVMGIVHYFWQTYLDKRQGKELEVLNQESMIEQNRPEKNTPIWYSIFPVLPLFLVIFFWIFFRKAKVGLVEITLFSLVPAVISELVRNKNAKETMKDLRLFFNGMGDGFSKVVVLIVAAATMVAGLRALGLIDAISRSVSDFENAKAGLMLAFSAITGLITFISGSGNAAFYSFIEIIPQIAEKAGLDPIMVALPMQCMSNLFRSMSPVAAVVIIVSASIKVNPLVLVKRTWVPLMAGVLTVLLLSFLKYI